MSRDHHFYNMAVKDQTSRQEGTYEEEEIDEHVLEDNRILAKFLPSNKHSTP